ncbi:MAG: hypothetical protein L6R42_011317 [Xanthoria sp. 1 TBL-2021]|nr:MAG: hypothetical protein L6R42_011317 [Xanthoria sp. 1 TBL-2021]
MGKNWETRKVAIQLAASPQLCVVPTASGPTSSLARMNGTGPSPKAKEATNTRVAAAARSLTPNKSPRASSVEHVPMPAILSRIHVFRPILSDKGAHTAVTTTLSADTATMSREAVVGRREDSNDTEYITILLIPVSCCVNITATTAIMAGR